MNKFKKALLVFWSFFKIGLFTFGGGYAMISVISAELVERRKWITQEDMTDMLIISEMTPGAIAVNSATFVGYRVAGVLGGILGTLGVVLPSLIIITVLSFFVHYLEEVAWLAAAFKGIQAVVVVLIVNAMVKFFKQLDKNWQSYLIAAAALIVTLLTDFNVIFLILAGGIYGIVYTLARDARKKKLLEKNLDGGENAAAEEDGAERVDQACGGAEERLFTIGGGYAMIPMITQEIVDEKGWLTDTQLLNYIGISESTPGPFAINIATFVGTSQGGVLGGVVATFSVVLPSLIIILIFAAIYSKISKNRFLRGAFDGIKPVVTGLISAAGVSIALQVILPLMNLKDFSSADSWFDKFDWVSLILVAAAFGASRIKIKNKKLNPVILIVGGGVVGYLVFGLLIPAVAPGYLAAG